MPGVFGNRQNENLDVIKRMLLSTLQPTESEALQMQAVKAVGAFILLHDKEPAIQKHFSDLLVPFMQVFSMFVCPCTLTAHKLLRVYFLMNYILP